MFIMRGAPRAGSAKREYGGLFTSGLGFVFLQVVNMIFLSSWALVRVSILHVDILGCMTARILFIEIMLFMATGLL